MRWMETAQRRAEWGKLKSGGIPFSLSYIKKRKSCWLQWNRSEKEKSIKMWRKAKSSFSSSISLISIVCSTLFHSHATLLFYSFPSNDCRPFPISSLRWMLNCKRTSSSAAATAGASESKKKRWNFRKSVKASFWAQLFPLLICSSSLFTLLFFASQI